MHLTKLICVSTKLRFWYGSKRLAVFVGLFQDLCFAIHVYIYIYICMKLQAFSNDFLKMKRKQIQMNLTTKDKSSEIHIAESIIIKSSDCEKLLGI